jgi:tripartite-type tricarboxylate transporter receptor subunit TctC
MKLPHRRQFLHLAAGAAALPAVSRIARAQAYPSRPVRIVVGFPAGGSASDIVARLIGQWLSERLGQQFVVENRPGAATNIATEAVVRAPPDGYTLLFVTSTNALNATIYDNLNFNFISDIAPVAGLIRVPFVMLVNPSVPAKTVPEFIAYAKANPGKLNVASLGTGSAPHVYGELFKAMTGVNMAHVPYRGSPFPDLLSGQVQVFFISIPPSIELIRSGKLRALAVTTATRQEVLPDIPTVGEFVLGYEASGWQGIGAPKNTPAEIIDGLNEEINAALADTKMKAQLVNSGGTVLALSPSDFGKLIAEETEKWGKVIRAANIKPE